MTLKQAIRKIGVGDIKQFNILDSSGEWLWVERLSVDNFIIELHQVNGSRDTLIESIDFPEIKNRFYDYEIVT